MSPVSAGKEVPALRASSVQKRRAILDAAIALFLKQGYVETTLDEIAADADVSKQTIYSHFGDKDQLFLATIDDMTARAETFVDELVSGLGATDDLAGDLRRMARRWLETLLDPRLVAFRHLVVAESRRFPEAAAAYYDRGPGRVLDAVALALEQLATRGLLRVDDSALAAQHLAWLILVPIDRAMFLGDRHGVSHVEADRIADAGVEIFLAAYGARPGAARGTRRSVRTPSGPARRAGRRRPG